VSFACPGKLLAMSPVCVSALDELAHTPDNSPYKFLSGVPAELKEAIRGEIVKQFGPYEGIFRDLLEKNGLEIIAKNALGIPIINQTGEASNKVRTSAPSHLVLRTLLQHSSVAKVGTEDEADDWIAKIDTINVSELSFETGSDEYRLHFTFGIMGLMVWVEDPTGQAVIGGLADGVERTSAQQSYQLIHQILGLH